MKKIMLCAAVIVAAMAMTGCSNCTCKTTAEGITTTTKVSKEDLKKAGFTKCSDLNVSAFGVEQKCN